MTILSLWQLLRIDSGPVSHELARPNLVAMYEANQLNKNYYAAGNQQAMAIFFGRLGKAVWYYSSGFERYRQYFSAFNEMKLLPQKDELLIDYGSGIPIVSNWINKNSGLEKKNIVCFDRLTREELEMPERNIFSENHPAHHYGGEEA